MCLFCNTTPKLREDAQTTSQFVTVNGWISKCLEHLKVSALTSSPGQAEFLLISISVQPDLKIIIK